MYGETFKYVFRWNVLVSLLSKHLNTYIHSWVIIWASSWDYGTYHTGDLRIRCAGAFAVRTHEEWK